MLAVKGHERSVERVSPCRQWTMRLIVGGGQRLVDVFSMSAPPDRRDERQTAAQHGVWSDAGILRSHSAKLE